MPFKQMLLKIPSKMPLKMPSKIAIKNAIKTNAVEKNVIGTTAIEKCHFEEMSLNEIKLFQKHTHELYHFQIKCCLNKCHLKKCLGVNKRPFIFFCFLIRSTQLNSFFDKFGKKILWGINLKSKSGSLLYSWKFLAILVTFENRNDWQKDILI